MGRMRPLSVGSGIGTMAIYLIFYQWLWPYAVNLYRISTNAPMSNATASYHPKATDKGPAVD
jgi:hypothetical protein